MVDFKIVLAGFVLINIVTFCIYGLDKRRAVKHKYRISEQMLLSLALIGGATGALFGMQVFRHKTKHPKFVIGVPVLLVLNIVMYYFIIILFSFNQ